MFFKSFFIVLTSKYRSCFFTLIYLFIVLCILASSFSLEAKSRRLSSTTHHKSSSVIHKSTISRKHSSSHRSSFSAVHHKSLNLSNISTRSLSSSLYKRNTSHKSTYKIGNTKYIAGESYKTTGQPKVERSESAKKNFLKQKGLTKVPPGYEIDHIIPLFKGGPDIPSNMELLPKSVHKQKSARERQK
ncbi:MAG: HNH endonuclease [Actinobacteria bacterium]|nr:HNH endonuclease [Actinomycetota bacterium]